MPTQTRRASRPRHDPTAYARLQHLRRRRKAKGWQVFELWLPPEDAALLAALKQPGETLTAVVGRLLRSHQAPAAADLSPQARRAALVARLRALRAAPGPDGKPTTYQAIADQLNAEGVPTVTGRGGWQKGTIRDLVREQDH